MPASSIFTSMSTSQQEGLNSQQPALPHGADDLRLSGNVVYIQDKISGLQVGFDGPPDAI